MARYFFNLRSPDGPGKDEIGTELPHAEAAYLQACETALELSFEILRERRDPARHAFEVTDSDGRIVFEVPFTEVTQPEDRRLRYQQTHASIVSNRERTIRALSELKEKTDHAQSLLNSMRELLSKA